MNWDEYFMRRAYLAAEMSKDPRTKIGAVLVRDGKWDISSGFNGFPAKVQDSPERYSDRNTKLKMIVHAEANSVLQCAKLGYSSLGTTLYTLGMPCNECMKTIIQGGITRIVLHKQWPEMTYSGDWVEAFRISTIMAREAEINISYLDKVLGIKGFCDGKEMNV